jgi:NodT family efflux transporter outer membrane factor (OMF) lipoprotein
MNRLSVSSSLLLQGRFAFFSLIILLLSGCMLGPDYKKPQIKDLPKSFYKKIGISKSRSFQFNDPMYLKLQKIALKKNLSLKEALTQIRQARASYWFQQADRLPLLDIGLSAIESQISGAAFPGIPAQGRKTGYFSALADFSWELDFFGRRRRIVRAQEARFESSRAAKNDVKRLIIAELASTYLNLRTQQELLHLAKEIVRSRKKLVSYWQSLVTDGLAEPTQGYEANAQLNVAKATLPTYRQGVELAMFRIAVLLGKEPQSLVKMLKRNPNGFIDIDVALPASTPAKILHLRPDVLRATNELKASVEEIGASWADMFPRLVLQGTYSHEAVSFSNLREKQSEAYRTEPRLLWSVFNIPRAAFNVSSSKAVASQALIRYRATALTALEEAEGALVKLNTALKKREINQSIVEDRERIFLITADRRNLGLDTKEQELTARINYFDSEISLMQARHEVSLSVVEVFKAFGGFKKVT